MIKGMVSRVFPFPTSKSSYIFLLLQRVPDIGSPGQRQHGHGDPRTPIGCEECRHLGKICGVREEMVMG